MEDTHELLNRYLDGDLSAGEASQVAATLASDRHLRRELESLSAVRAAVRRVPAPPDAGDAEQGRLRTLSALRARVATEGWHPAPAQTLPVSALPTITTLLTVVTVVGGYLLLPTPWHHPSTTRKVPPPARHAAPQRVAASLPAPSDEEIGLLFDLHDAQSGAATSDDLLSHRHHAATAQAALLKRAETSVAERL